MGHLLNGARSEAAASDRRLLQRQRRPRTANFVTAPDLVLQCNYDTLDLPCPNTAFDLLFEETAVTLGLVAAWEAAAELLLAESVCTWPPKHRTRENDSALPPASSLPLPPNFPSASELFPPSRSALQARRRKLGVWLTAGLCALGLAIVVYGFATNGRRSEPSLESWSREEPSEPTTDILAAEK